jgi:hypothetical protein
MPNYSVYVSLEVGRGKNADFSSNHYDFENIDDRNAAANAYFKALESIRRTDRSVNVIMLTRKEEGKIQELVPPTWVTVCLALNELTKAKREIARLKRQLKRARQ